MTCIYLLFLLLIVLLLFAMSLEFGSFKRVRLAFEIVSHSPGGYVVTFIHALFTRSI